MQETPDAQLLRDYAENGNEAAFREIVVRHTDLVYSAALRQVTSTDMAQDIAQSVFVDLARKAKPVGERFAANASLVGWLYRSTRFAVLNHLRGDRRRATHERQAMEQLITDCGPTQDWERIRPLLDEAMDDLNDDDRDAVLLRYFKNHDFRAVGSALGLSDDAAQKRVSRAVERLREFFSKRGVTIGASGLVFVISANAVQSAPAVLATTISTAAVLTGTTIHTSTAITATKAIAMTTLQKTLVATTVAVLAGTGIYQASQASRLRNEVQTLQRQQSPLNDQIAQLQRERDEMKDRLTAATEENTRLKSSQDLAELLKLRGEVGVLRGSAAANATNNTAAAAVAQLMGTSTSRELSRVQLRQKVKTKYAALIHQLNLSPKDEDKFSSLIVENEMKKKDMLARLLSGDLDVDSALQSRDALKTDVEGQLAALLGDAAYGQYGQYNHETVAAEAVKRLNDQLGSLALNDDQTKSLEAMLAGGPDINVDEVDLFRSKEGLDAIYQMLVERGRHDLEQAASILSPEQMAAAQTIQSNYLQTIRTSMTLGQQLLTSTAKQNGR